MRRFSRSASKNFETTCILENSSKAGAVTPAVALRGWSRLVVEVVAPEGSQLPASWEGVVEWSVDNVHWRNFVPAATITSLHGAFFLFLDIKHVRWIRVLTTAPGLTDTPLVFKLAVSRE